MNTRERGVNRLEKQKAAKHKPCQELFLLETCDMAKERISLTHSKMNAVPLFLIWQLNGDDAPQAKFISASPQVQVDLGNIRWFTSCSKLVSYAIAALWPTMSSSHWTWSRVESGSSSTPGSTRSGVSCTVASSAMTGRLCMSTPAPEFNAPPALCIRNVWIRSSTSMFSETM